jgi:hypothetical protein
MGCIIAAVVVAFGAIAFIVAALLLVGPLARRFAVAQARERGFELEPGELAWGLGWIQLKGASFKLIGVSGVAGRIARVDADFNGLELSEAKAAGINVDIEGSAARLALELGDWSRRYPKAYRMNVTASDIDVAWRSQAGGAPWLNVSHANVAPNPSGGTMNARSVKLSGVDLGQVSAGWAAGQSSVALGFGEADPNKAPVQVRIDRSRQPATIEVTLAPTDIRKLSGPLGFDVPLEGVTASGKALLNLPPELSEGPVDGNVDLRLDGFVPPHPRELDGYMFGNVTTVSTKVRIAADRQTATLTDTQVKTGAFRLVGSGALVRVDDYARIQLLLRGSLPCGELINASAESYLGRTIGRLVGAAASRILQGSIGITVKIDADTRNLTNARVIRTIGVGCGLRPLEIDLSDLPPLPGFPGGLSGIPSSLSSLGIPSGLIPSSLPPIGHAPTTFPSSLPIPTIPSSFSTSFKFPSAPPPTATQGKKPAQPTP